MSKYIKNIIDINGVRYDILIGKNSFGNEEIINLMKNVNENSIWFHFETISSPHIILDNKEDVINKKNLKKVGMLLYKHKKNVPKNEKIIYT